VKIFDGLSTVVAFILEQIHNGLSKVLPDDSGWAWGLSIVFLTITVRIVLFPLFVKQIKSQRRMQEIAPKVKELQAKHKGDRETLNVELMKLYKDHGTNPISGCLPLILQLPIFFALFRVMNEVKPKGDGSFEGKYGLSDELIGQAAHAKVFGAPISAAFNSKASLLAQLDASSTTVKVVAALMIVTMGATTFLTQRQMMARNGAPADPQQAQVQKIMLYVLPLSFAVFGFSFPIGVLLYWLTTNLWSMGQQHYVIRRMPPVVPGAGAGKVSLGKKGDKDVAPPRGKQGPEPDAPPAGPTPPSKPPARPANRKSAGSRKNKQRKGGRR
jgi:YidC/Oxa1 family membrane protein insertase